MIEILYNPIFGFIGFTIEKPVYYEVMQWQIAQRWDLKLMPENWAGRFASVV